MSAPFQIITNAGKQLTKFLSDSKERPNNTRPKKEPAGLMTKFVHAVKPTPGTAQKRTHAVLRELSKLHAIDTGSELPDYDYCERLIKKGLGGEDTESLHRVAEYLTTHDQTELAMQVFSNSQFPYGMKGSSSGDTLLHTAAMRGNVEIAKFLIEQGIDVNTKDRNGFTPLEQAGIRQYDSDTHKKIADMLGGYSQDGEKTKPVNEDKDEEKRSKRDEIEETARQMTAVPDNIVAPRTARFTKNSPKNTQ